MNFKFPSSYVQLFALPRSYIVPKICCIILNKSSTCGTSKDCMQNQMIVATPVPGGPKYLIAEEAGVLLFSKFEASIKPDLSG